ncbi:MAG TPA: acetolactate synthase small subunit [Candidatus Dormibacteraeota bacterium]|jgi:acetolactate synthase-1/3 small subunit
MPNLQARLLSVLVENKPGVLQRVASMIRRRGFNIDSLSVGPTDDGNVSRMTITVHVGRQQAEQAMKQLYKLVDVIKIDDITTERVVAQELVLIKLNAPARSRGELLDLVSMFSARVVDVASNTLIVELTGPAGVIDDFISLVQPYGIKEIARSGAVAMVRGNTARLRLVDREHDHDYPEEPEARVPQRKVSAAAADTTGDI